MQTCLNQIVFSKLKWGKLCNISAIFLGTLYILQRRSALRVDRCKTELQEKLYARFGYYFIQENLQI